MSPIYEVKNCENEYVWKNAASKEPKYVMGRAGFCVLISVLDIAQYERCVWTPTHVA